MRGNAARVRRLRTALLGAAAILAAALWLGAGPASAAVNCSVTPGMATITMLGDTATVTKGGGSHIQVNGVWCHGATTSDTTYVVVQGNGIDDVLVIDLSGGDFEPSADNPDDFDNAQNTSEGKNDIEFVLYGVESLSIVGGAGADTITIGEGSSVDPSWDACTYAGIVNLNDDADADVWYDECNDIDPDISVSGAGNDDDISGVGDDGTGTPENDGLAIAGGPGNDDIKGGDGDDWLEGGPGDDVIDGDDSREDSSLGAECSVQLDITTGQLEDTDWVEGDWVVYAFSAGPVTVNLDPGESHPGSASGEGSDVLENIENVLGSGFADTISGDDTNNLIYGGAGDDTIAGDAGNDCEWGAAGNDTFDENEGTPVAQGGDGTDNGSDLIVGGAGADDAISYSGRSTRVVVYLEPLPQEADVENRVTHRAATLNDFCTIQAPAPPRGAGTNIQPVADGADLNGDGDSLDDIDEGDCVFLDVENASTGSGNDILFAAYTNNRADNDFAGGSGNDVEIGGAGNDRFREGSIANGADDIDGGTGSDTCDYGSRSNPVSVSLDGVDNDGETAEGDDCGGVYPGWVPYWASGYDAGRSTGTTGPEGDPQSGQDVENAVGGSGNDRLVGSDAGNTLDGNGGNDSLSGGASTDTLNGGEGDDRLLGGPGNDALNGGGGANTADFSGAGAGGTGVNVNLSTGQASGDGNDTLTSIQNVNGSSFSDAIRGDGNANTLNGRGGDDQIQAVGGDDRVNGGAGADEISAGSGNDRVYGATGADVLRGNAGNDLLNGGNGPDTLYGGKGDDALSGGAGDDWHGGGPGTDSCDPGAPGLGNGDEATGCET